MSVRALRLLSARLARHWLLTLIVSVMSMFTASYFYFTTMHALESFDTASCTPLTHDSPSGNCVSSLQALLNEDEPYPAVSVDGYFGSRTKQAVMNFQSVHQLTPDGVVADKTANALNEFSPRPSILSYGAGFMNSRLTLSAKLCVVALIMAVTIICLLLRAARDGTSTRLRIRCALTGLFAALIAANSAATGSLIADTHGWAAKFLGVTLAALTAVLVKLLSEQIPSMSALRAFADPSSQETSQQIEARYGR